MAIWGMGPNLENGVFSLFCHYCREVQQISAKILCFLMSIKVTFLLKIGLLLVTFFSKKWSPFGILFENFRSPKLLGTLSLRTDCLPEIERLQYTRHDNSVAENTDCQN